MKFNSVINWAQSHPWKTALRAVWLVANFIFGFWAANQIPWFAGAHGSQFLKISIGILGGVIPLLVWGLQTWYLVSGKEQLAKRLRNGILIGIGAIVFSLLVVFLIQLYLFGQIAPINRDHVVIYNRLWKAMDRAYPYFDEKGVDWDVVYDKYLPEVEEAGSSDAFYQAISRMLLTLEDSHTGLLSPPANIRCCFGLVSEIEGQAVVTLPGRIAQEAGIETGSILLEVGGRSIESALKDLPPRLTHGSTDWLNRANSFDLLLSTGREAEKLEVRFQDLSGEEHRVDLVWPDENTPTGGGSQIISSKKLESGIGYIQIEVFGNSPETDLVEAFDQALNDLWDCPGLIVDLRGNRGGNSALGDQIAGRFYKNKTLYGKPIHPAPLEGLTAYYDHMAKLAEGYTKDPDVLRENLNHIRSWQQDIARLIQMLGHAR